MNKKTIKIIIIATLFSFIGLFEQSSIPIILPKLSSVLNINSYLVNWVSICYLLFCVACGLTLGKVVSRFGMIKVGKITTVIMIIGALISSLILNTYAILFAKSLQGVCAAAFFIISYLIIIRCVEQEYVGLALGFASGGGFLAVVLAPILGGFLAYYLSPQLIFTFTIPLSVICLILLFTFKEEWQEDVEIDGVGTLIWIIAMVFFIYGVSFLNTKTGTLCFVVSLFLIALFVKYEIQTQDPLYDFRLLKNRIYSRDNYSSMMGLFIYNGLIFVLTLYLQYTGIFTSIQTGGFIGFLGVVVFISTLISIKLVDIFDSRKLTIVGALIMTVSTFILLFKLFIPLPIFLFFIVMLSIGYSIFVLPNKKLVLESLDDSNLADGTAFFSTIRDLGSLLPTVIYTLCLSIFYFVDLKIGYLEFTLLFMLILFFLIALSILILNIKSVRQKSKF